MRRTPQETTLNHDYIDNHHIIDRFLMGKLATEEADAFQDHTMTCQRCLDDLAMAERMHRGMQLVYQMDGSSAWKPVGNLFTWWQRQNTFMRGLLTFATVLLFAAPSLFIAWHLLAVRKELVASQATMAQLEEQVLEIASTGHHNIPLVRLSPLRSSSVEPDSAFQVHLKPASSMLVLILEVDAEVAGPMKASLKDDTGAEVWASSSLLLNTADEITLGLPTTILLGGTYNLTLTKKGQTLALFSFFIKYLNP